MLIKIVLDKQIRILSCQQIPTLNQIYQFIKITFFPTRNYVIYHLSSDGDQIVLETDYCIQKYLQNCSQKPKLYIKFTGIQLIRNNLKNNSQHLGSKIFIDEEQFDKDLQPQNIIADQIRQKDLQTSTIFNDDTKNHHAKCSSCKSFIIGIRYRCGICSNFDLCQQCQQTYKHEHPLLKIRQNNQNPLKIILQYDNKQKKYINSSAFLFQPCKLKYQTAAQRQQYIVSYLQNLLGDIDNKIYIKFSKYTKQETFEGIFEDYLNWLQKDKQKIPKIIQFFKQIFKAPWQTATICPFI